jgi:outer membrane protein TolC
MPRTALVILLLAARMLATAEPPALAQPLVLTLADALRLAHTQGREMHEQAENLALAAQAFSNARGDYRPQLSARLNTGVSGPAGGTRTSSSGATAEVSQILPGNGTVTLSGSTSHSDRGTGLETTSTGLSVNYTQPLLRDAGYQVWRERLTAAERTWLYTQRSHERFRQQLSLNTARSYWNLQRTQDGLAQARAAEARADFIHRQTRALMSIGRSNANDVFRAEVSLLNAQQGSLDAEAAFAAELNAFKQSLALPTGQALTLPADLPPARSWRCNATLAISTALARRPDFQTTLDGLEDARRQVPLARQRLWADLTLSGQADWTGGAQRPWSDTLRNDPVLAANLTLTLPLDRRSEQLDYDTAVVTASRAERSVDAARQDIVRAVVDGLAALRRADASRLIQARNRAQSRKRLEKARLDFQAGEIANRDLVEAQDEVLLADKAWAAALTDWTVAALTLRFDTGTLVIDAAGAWDETPPPFATLDEDAK